MLLKDFNTDDGMLTVTRKAWGDNRSTWIFSNRTLCYARRNRKENVLLDANDYLIDITIDDMCADDWEEIDEIVYS